MTLFRSSLTFYGRPTVVQSHAKSLKSMAKSQKSKVQRPAGAGTRTWANQQANFSFFSNVNPVDVNLREMREKQRGENLRPVPLGDTLNWNSFIHWMMKKGADEKSTNISNNHHFFNRHGNFDIVHDYYSWIMDELFIFPIFYFWS